MPALPGLQECHTIACLDAASYFTKFIDSTVDPCDNFYDYACGSSPYMDEPIPVWASSVGTMDDMDDVILGTIRDIMESSYQDLLKSNTAPDFVHNESMETDQDLFRSLQAYYGSCMDTDALEKAGPTPIYPVIQQVKRTWPGGHASGLTNVLIELASLNLFPLVRFEVNPDVLHDPSRYILETGSPSPEYETWVDFTDPESVHNFRLFLTEVTTHILIPAGPAHVAALEREGMPSLKPSQVKTFVDHAIDFGKTISKASMLDATGYQGGSNKEDPIMPFGEIQSNYTFMDWQYFLESVFPKGKHVPESIYNRSPAYFKQITTVIHDTDQEIIMDYFLSQVILSQIPHLDSTVNDLAVKYGYRVPQPLRWRMCAISMRTGVSNLIGRYYLMKKFGGARERREVDKYISLIHQTYRSRLERTEWLDDATRARALEKIDKLKHYVSYSISQPDERSPEDLKSFFGNMVFGNGYLANQLTIARWKGLQDAWRYVNEVVDKSSPKADFLRPSAYHDPSINTFKILAGILQHPIYDVDYPAYVNLGSLGSIIGHEMTHGYDNGSRHFDGDGRMFDWWTNQTLTAFYEKARYFVDQYSQFGFDYENKTYYVDGVLTLNENIADNGGLAVAYESFTNYWKSNSSTRVTLPGIDLTPEQLFFVSVPSGFCGRKEVKAIVDELRTELHSPGSVRVVATFQNFEPFAKAFNCPVGSNMNPEKKCVLW